MNLPSRERSHGFAGVLIFVVPAGVVVIGILDPTFVSLNPTLYALMLLGSLIFALVAYSLHDRGRGRR